MSVFGTSTGWSRGIAAALLLSALAPASSALASSLDFRDGSFYGTWCGEEALFTVFRHEPDSWLFDGTIQILRTGESNEVWIQQYSDDSLEIERILEGQFSGQTQVARTYPPYESYGILFEAVETYGVGCEDPGNSSILLPS